MTHPQIAWLHAPGHAGSMTKPVIKLAVEQDPLIIDWSEMYWNTDELIKHALGYDHFIGKVIRRDKRGRPVNHDVVISTKRGAMILHDEEFFVSKEIPQNLKYMPERHGKARVIEYDGERILIIAWHPQPNPFRRAALVLPSYRRGVKRVHAIQDKLVKAYQPDLILNGGDLQLGAGLLYPYPNRFAKRARMSYKRNSIDWQMWKGLAYKVVSFTKLTPQTVSKGMDHKWLLLKLRKQEGKAA